MRSTEIKAWIDSTNTITLLEAIHAGVPPTRAATAAHVHGKLTRAHVFALYDVLPKFAKLNTGVRDKGTILYRWLTYLREPGGVGIEELATAANDSTKSLLVNVKRSCVERRRCGTVHQGAPLGGAAGVSV